MKTIIYLTLACCFLYTHLNAQDYKFHAGISYLKDTLLYQEHTITPGDTLFLGKGTGVDNAFKYVFVHDLDKFAAGPQVMSSKYTNNFLVFKGIEEKTMLGQKLPDFSFNLNNNRYQSCFVILQQAFKSGELLLPPHKFISRAERKRLKKQGGK